ncbi:hypothetical protein F5Y03DRAFT_394877 [Xylaria venustula]|nr:hypothetical protein F5Y03DRAFT_394877 [Xylaria venustula]
MDQVETVNRALQQCIIIDEALGELANQRKYRQTSQELVNILGLLHSSPRLCTREVMDCISDISDTVTKIGSIGYRDLFDRLEYQNNTLAACVHRERLGTLPTTSNGRDVDPSVPDAIPPVLALGSTAHGVTHTEDGTQVIGQRVGGGNEIQRLTGDFSNNTHRGSGDQVIGYLLE